MLDVSTLSSQTTLSPLSTLPSPPPLLSLSLLPPLPSLTPLSSLTQLSSENDLQKKTRLVDGKRRKYWSRFYNEVMFSGDIGTERRKLPFALLHATQVPAIQFY